MKEGLIVRGDLAARALWATIAASRRDLGAVGEDNTFVFC